jgi:hypothetical protein
MCFSLALFLICCSEIIHDAYALPTPPNVANMFENRLNGIDSKDKARIRIGLSALCWKMFF